MTLKCSIPPAGLYVLFMIAFLSMLMPDSQFCILDKGSIIIKILPAVSYAVVVFLKIVIDRLEKGSAKLDQKHNLTIERQFQVLNLRMRA